MDDYIIRILPLDNDIYPQPDHMYPTFEVNTSKGLISFDYKFEEEQEYYIRIFEKNNVSDRNHIVQLSVYAVMEDLYNVRPYRGDFHSHSNYSDGKESPEYIAAMYRKNGFDFFALTDHEKYNPSLEAIDAYSNTNIGLTIFPGEEIHLKNNHIHIVNFGGNQSINEFAKENEDQYFSEVNKLVVSLDIPDNINKFEYSSCVWIMNKIREAGGIGIFCHPYCISNVYHVPQAFTEYMLKQKTFDVFELLGGQSVKENNLQIALYNKYNNDNNIIPIVGSSDAHGTVNSDWFKWSSTIIFSKDKTISNIKKAFTNGYSVAVDKFKDNDVRVYGDHRLVKYAIFLLEHYFPIHDELCFEEGLQMLRYTNSESDAENMLNLLYKRTDIFLGKCFNNHNQT